MADLTLLLFDKRSGWQQRAPLREQAGTAGRYETEVNVPTGTGYELFVGSVSKEVLRRSTRPVLLIPPRDVASA